MGRGVVLRAEGKGLAGAALRLTLPGALRELPERTQKLVHQPLLALSVQGLRLYPTPLATRPTIDLIMIFANEDAAKQAQSERARLIDALGDFLADFLGADSSLSSLSPTLNIVFDGLADYGRMGVLIGITSYDDRSALRGSVNDVHLVKEVLTSHYKFPASQLWCLTSGSDRHEPTKANICGMLEFLAQAAVTDDVLVIHYSGHGSYTETATGRQECLVVGGRCKLDGPETSDDSPPEALTISDKYMADTLHRLGNVTRYTVIILDCCYSAGQTRESENGLSVVRNQIKKRPAATAGAPRATEAPLARLIPTSDRYVQLCACEAHEMAVEMCVQDRYFGCFTYYLCDALRQRPAAQVTFADVWEPVRARVTAYNQRQHPCIAGNISKEVFGLRHLEPVRFLRVSTVAELNPTDALTQGGKDSRFITLGGGAAHCVTVGSLYDIHNSANASRPDPALRVGQARVTVVHSLTCRALFTPAEGASVAVGMQAFEVAHSTDARLRVHLVELGPQAPGNANEAWHRLRAALKPPLCRAARDEAELIVRQSDGRWQLLDPLGNRRFDDVVAGDEAASVIITDLHKYARYAEGIALRNTDPESKIVGQVESVRVFALSPSGAERRAVDSSGAVTEAHVGDRLHIEVRSCSPEPIHFVVLEFAENYWIECLYPRTGRPALLAPHATVRAELGGVAASHASWQAAGPYHTTLMLVAMRSDRVDFAYVDQFGSSRAHDADPPLSYALPRTALASFLARSGLQRNPEPLADGALQCDWGTITRVVPVQPASAIAVPTPVARAPPAATDEQPTLDADLQLPDGSKVPLRGFGLAALEATVAARWQRPITDLAGFVYESQGDWVTLQHKHSSFSRAKLIKPEWKT